MYVAVLPACMPMYHVYGRSERVLELLKLELTIVVRQLLTTELSLQALKVTF